MTTKRAFGQAVALWESTRLTATDDDFATLETAERVILAYMPSTLADAASMLEVVMEQRGDGRSDGLDLRALDRIVALLRAGAAMDMRSAQAPGSVVDFRSGQA